MIAVRAVFWASVFLVVVTYVLYPAVMGLLARRRRHDPPPAALTALPRVTILIAAHDEAEVIGRRLENLAALDYPTHLVDILVLSDGSTDGTVAEARAHAPANARVIESIERRGKSAILDRALGEIQGEIVVFTDANSAFETDALRHLVAPFADPGVGCVVGELTYANTENPRVGRGEGLYWRYENVLKRWESQLGSTIVANGSIYATRRDLIRPVAHHVDFDSMLPLQVLVAGYRVLFEPRARAREKAAESLGEELGRKVRIIVQQISGLVVVPGVLSPARPRVALMLLCHKVLRWAVPLLLVANLAAATALGAAPSARVAVSLHAVVAAAAAIGWLLDRLGLPAGWLWVATYFWGVNLASVAALLSFLLGRRIRHWEKAPSTR